jgi:hypothetical protein
MLIVISAISHLMKTPIFDDCGDCQGIANYMLKRYGEAVRLLRESALRVPNLQWPHVWLASVYAHAGQLEEARAEAAELLRINPGFTIESWPPNKDPKDAKHDFGELRKAGLTES